MYNRYIPNANGSYSRQIVHDQPPIEPPCEPQQPVIVPCQQPEPACRCEHPLRRFLPCNLDTGDLLVVLILLLLLIDSEQDEMWSVILTIAAFILL